MPPEPDRDPLAGSILLLTAAVLAAAGAFVLWRECEAPPREPPAAPAVRPGAPAAPPAGRARVAEGDRGAGGDLGGDWGPLRWAPPAPAVGERALPAEREAEGAAAPRREDPEARMMLAALVGFGLLAAATLAGAAGVSRLRPEGAERAA